MTLALRVDKEIKISRREDSSLEVHVMYPDSGLKYEIKELEKINEEPEKEFGELKQRVDTLIIWTESNDAIYMASISKLLKFPTRPNST